MEELEELEESQYQRNRLDKFNRSRHLRRFREKLTIGKKRACWNNQLGRIESKRTRATTAAKFLQAGVRWGMADLPQTIVAPRDVGGCSNNSWRIVSGVDAVGRVESAKPAAGWDPPSVDGGRHFLGAAGFADSTRPTGTMFFQQPPKIVATPQLFIA